ncbi:hypothetical protein [Umezawaea sp.]|uniref:hypothetical protein n=1 Tax=Umezawaea sp. TaxID=1955258 RepID=UPI002ED1B415
MLVAGDGLVSGLVGELGWHDVIDLGDLSGTRGTGVVPPPWSRRFGTRATERSCPTVAR